MSNKGKDRLYESLGGGRRALDHVQYNAENGLTSQGNEPGRKKVSASAYENDRRRTVINNMAEQGAYRSGEYNNARSAAKTGHKAGERAARGSARAGVEFSRASDRKKAAFEKAFGGVNKAASYSMNAAGQTASHRKEKTQKEREAARGRR